MSRNVFVIDATFQSGDLITNFFGQTLEGLAFSAVTTRHQSNGRLMLGGRVNEEVGQTPTGMNRCNETGGVGLELLHL